MMASFCFALFSFQLDKVDETIIFVIGQSSRNVIAEDFCRWRASAMGQAKGKMCSGMLGFPPSSLSPEDGSRIPTSPASPTSLRQEVISRERGLWSSRQKQAGRRQYVSFLSFSPSPLGTHLYWGDLHPRVRLTKAIRHVRSYAKVPGADDDSVCDCAST